MNHTLTKQKWTRRSQEYAQKNDSILVQVREGMDVYTRDDHHIGEVESVFFGATDETSDEMGTGATTARTPANADQTWFEELADLFRTDEVPEEVRERLMRKGFIRIDADGLFASDRYATPTDISSVTSDRVILNSVKSDFDNR